MRRYLLPLAMIVLCAGAVGDAQQAPADATAGQTPVAQFRAETNFVEISAIVTDREGNFVRDLTKEDFQIYEDGQLKTPAIFSLVDLPLRPPSPLVTQVGETTRPLEPDVRSSRAVFEGRLYVLVLDDLHTTIFRTADVKDAAKRFIEQYMDEGDLVAIVCTSGRDESEQELTGSRAALIAAIDKFYGRKLPSPGSEKMAVHLRDQIGQDEANADGTTVLRSPEGLDRARQIRDPLDRERSDTARRALRTIANVSTWMADVPGRRKALLLFSEGIEYDIYEPFNSGEAGAILQATRDAVTAAQRANVVVYGVDPRGLNQLGEAVGFAGRSDYPQLDFGTFRGVARELLLAQESLISLAQQTGGFAIVNTNAMAEGLSRVALDNSRYYLMGYLGEPADRRARFRKIEVKVTRPGLQVRARRGYMPVDPKAVAEARAIEARSGTSPALRAALRNPLPVSSLPFRVFAAPFKGTSKNASVLIAIEVDGGGLRFSEAEGRFNENVELSIVAVDQSARVRGEDRQTFDLKLRPETHEQVRRSGMRMISRLELPPGRYQLRVGVHEATGAAFGAIQYDLDVPDYSKPVFALSGLALTSSRAGELATPSPDALLDGALPGAPVASRVFAPQDVLTVFTEAYLPPARVTSAVEFATTVRGVTGGPNVFGSRDTQTAEVARNASTLAHTAEIPLKGLRPGMYVLRVEATPSTGGENQSTARELLFEVQ